MAEVYTTSGTLHPAAPFDFEKSLAFLETFEAMQGEQTIEKRQLVKTIVVLGQPILCQLRWNESVEEPELTYSFLTAQPISENIQEAAVERINFFLSLQDGLAPFYAIARNDEPLKRSYDVFTAFTR